MNELETLLNDIENLRQNLYSLINKENSNLLDAEIIVASQMLNAALTKYNEIIMKKMNP